MQQIIVLDTCILILDSLNPGRLSKAAQHAISEGEKKSALSCSDISLWEIAMLVKKQRLNPGTDCLTFMQLILDARQIRVIPITPQIADLSVSMSFKDNLDPADRIIAATAKFHKGKLVTSDGKLRKLKGLKTIW
jgi:PIN domain nuclease of toxin-antitoxin system